MKKIISLLLILTIIFTSNISFAKAADGNVSTLENIISEGRSISDDSSASAFVWINKVINFNENYPNSYVYNDIKKEANDAKGYTRISTFNKKNIILGYLENLKDELNNSGTKNINTLLNDAKKTSSYDDPEAYKWLIDIQKAISNYEDYSISNKIKAEVKDAKGYSSVSTFNKYNIIVGYLSYLLDETNNIIYNNINDLINEGNSITDWSSSNAYKWVIKVEDYNLRYPETSVYSDLKSKCEDAEGYSSVSTFNTNSLILADLMIMKDEVPVSSVYKGLEVANPPYRVIYNEGDVFEKNGLVVNAIYECTYSNGSKKDRKVAISNYQIQVSNPLTCNDDYVRISYTEGGITKIVNQEITVNPTLISETLTGISIVSPPRKTEYNEGETFEKYGMKVDATYSQVWSNGSRRTVTKQNVSYSVDTSKQLTTADTSVTVTVSVGGVTKRTEQPIIVRAYVISTTLESIEVVSLPTKTSYIEGERFNKEGLVVKANYKKIWSNGYVETITENNVNYSVDTSSPLFANTKSITVTFIRDGIKKTTQVSISVKPADDSSSLPKVKNLKVKNNSKKMLTIKFKKIRGAKKYKIQCATDRRFKKNLRTKTIKNNYYKIKKLRKNTTYFIRVCAIKGTEVGPWSKCKKIKIRK